MASKAALRRRSGGKRRSNRRLKRRGLKKLMKRLNPDSSLGAQDLVDIFRDWLEQEVGKTSQTNFSVFALLVLGFFISMSLSAFAILIPLTHGVIGYALHSEEGWKFFQPGKGGPRFIALQGLAWGLYAVTVFLHAINFVVQDFALQMTATFSGFLAFSFLVSSLLSFRSKYAPSIPSVEASKTDEDYEWIANEAAPQFNESIQNSIIMMNGDTPSGLWWVFISLQAALAIVTAWAMMISDRQKINPFVRTTTAMMGLLSFASVVPVTHALGGKWKNFRSNWRTFQPGVGGSSFVAFQIVGWTMYAFTLLLGAIAVASNAVQIAGGRPIMPFAMVIASLSGLTAQSSIVASLFFFRETSKSTSNPIFQEQETITEEAARTILDYVFIACNILFRPNKRPDKNGQLVTDPMLYSRDPTLTSPDDHLKADARWEECIKSTEMTGDQYLIVGVGFVGKRLVNRLLERGERKIRIFDISPHNPFENDSRVEYIRGDVTKIDDISKACEGVDTIYATFALIRFMDRLDHQAFISYHVNVTGTKVLFEAVKQHNISRVVVTSSSHATTDEHSQPRLNRDESAPYVTRDTAHNHYGWTKALADKYALEQNGEKLSNGEEIKVVIVRPCSGVFGADDKLSFEKCFDMGVAPGIGIDGVMDWVYVENVVLGHLLAEARLQDGTEGVAGEAFNISNNDATSWLDFWFLAKKIANMNPPEMSKLTNIKFVFVPMSAIWLVAYISEAVQRVFKGRVSLGRDVDSLTPAMLQTALMEYSYNSDKAEALLGYKPAFTLEEGIQRSVFEYHRNKNSGKA